jgi:hypothetical protein
VAHRLIGPRDRKAIAEWFEAQGDPGQEKEALAELTKLETGVAYVFSPAFLKIFKQVTIREKRTFDSSATPEVGEKKLREPTGRAEVDLQLLGDRMRDTIERAKADDPKALRRRIAELEKKLAAEPAAAEAPEPERVEIPVLTDDARRAIEAVYATVADATDALVEATRDAKRELEAIVNSLPKPAAPAHLPARRSTGRAPMGAARGSGPSARRPAQPTGSDAEQNGSQLGKAPRALLVTLIGHQPRRLTKAELSTLSGYKPRSSTYRNALSALRTAGYLDETGGLFAPSQAGLDAYGAEAPPPAATTEDLLAMWRAALGKASVAMLDTLVYAYPDEVAREDLAAHTGYSLSSSTFRNAVSALRTNGLLEDLPDGSYRASEALFLSGAARG